MTASGMMRASMAMTSSTRGGGSMLQNGTPRTQGGLPALPLSPFRLPFVTIPGGTAHVYSLWINTRTCEGTVEGEVTSPGGRRTRAVMAVLRGKGLGLEIALGGRDFEDALAELQGKLDERPGFYSGTPATAALGGASLSEEQLARLRTILNDHGIA